MTRAIAAALALSTALVACGGSSQDPGPQTVEQAVAAFEAAYQAKDPDALVALCQFPFILDGTELTGADQLRTYLRSTFTGAGEIARAEVLDPVVVREGDTVRVTGTFHLVDSVQGESSRPVTIRGELHGQRWVGTGFSQE
jgi:ketosteroid isomerase-like protein